LVFPFGTGPKMVVFDLESIHSIPYVAIQHDIMIQWSFEPRFQIFATGRALGGTPIEEKAIYGRWSDQGDHLRLDALIRMRMGTQGKILRHYGKQVEQSTLGAQHFCRQLSSYRRISDSPCAYASHFAGSDDPAPYSILPLHDLFGGSPVND
jgi:hypothetical protein